MKLVPVVGIVWWSTLNSGCVGRGYLQNVCVCECVFVREHRPNKAQADENLPAKGKHAAKSDKKGEYRRRLRMIDW